MGQYHVVVNLDKLETVHPHALGLGLKQYEQIGEAGLGDAIYLLTTASPNRGGGDLPFVEGVSGRWVGDRVVVVGDYTEEGDIPNSPIPAGDLYGSPELIDITEVVANAFGEIFGYRYEGDGWRNRVADTSHWMHS